MVRPIIIQQLFSPFSRATYAMDRVDFIPLYASQILRHAYFPPAYDGSGPTLCRLYLSKPYPATLGRFFSSANFPLDAMRYTHLRESIPANVELPELSEVASGMGEMLGHLHFIGRYDARDVEIVLGGDGFSGFSFNLIDFNQVE